MSSNNKVKFATKNKETMIRLVQLHHLRGNQSLFRNSIKRLFTQSHHKEQQQQRKVKIVEVGPRDGLQNEKNLVTTPVALGISYNM